MTRPRIPFVALVAYALQTVALAQGQGGPRSEDLGFRDLRTPLRALAPCVPLIEMAEETELRENSPGDVDLLVLAAVADIPAEAALPGSVVLNGIVQIRSLPLFGTAGGELVRETGIGGGSFAVTATGPTLYTSNNFPPDAFLEDNLNIALISMGSPAGPVVLEVRVIAQATLTDGFGCVASVVSMVDTSILLPDGSTPIPGPLGVFGGQAFQGYSNGLDVIPESRGVLLNDPDFPRERGIVRHRFDAIRSDLASVSVEGRLFAIAEYRTPPNSLAPQGVAYVSVLGQNSLPASRTFSSSGRGRFEYEVAFATLNENAFNARAEAAEILEVQLGAPVDALTLVISSLHATISLRASDQTGALLWVSVSSLGFI